MRLRVRLQPRRRLQELRQGRLRRQVGDGGDASELPHGVAPGRLAEQVVRSADVKRAMPLEPGDAAENPSVQEVGHPPLDALLDVGDGPVNHRAQVLEEGRAKGAALAM